MTRFTPDLFAGAEAELTAIRRDIHRHPETAFEEVRTAQIVADKLQGWGIEVHRGLATKVGSVPRSGMAPWPPVPLKVTSQLSDEASMAPARMAKVPLAMPGMLCMP